MANIPHFTVTPSPENPDNGLVISFIKDEWEHLEDHDETLLTLNPVIQRFVGEKLDDRTLDRLKASIEAHLYQLVQTDQIYEWPGWRHYLENRWVHKENNKRRLEERGVARP